MSSTPKPAIPLSEAINGKYYPSLNGLRCLSILLVVTGHLGFYALPYAGKIVNGALGVDMFFVLSGFLITSLCIKELDSTGGHLSLKDFYTRRALRIFPLAYLYLLFIVVLNWVFTMGIPWFQMVGAGCYVLNFSYFRAHSFSWPVSHYWSLSVEEQFYLIFPFILKINRKLFTWCLLFIVFGLPLLCTVQYFVPAINHGVWYGFTHYFIKFHAISVGCLCAVMAFKRYFDTPYLLKTKVPGNIVAFFLIFWLGYDDFFSVPVLYTNLIISSLVAYVIISNIIPSGDVFYRLFNFKPIAFIGIMSYSIYIWQQIFTSGDVHLPKYMVGSPYKYAWIMVVPVISYFGYERYFLRLKKRFSRV